MMHKTASAVQIAIAPRWSRNGDRPFSHDNGHPPPLKPTPSTCLRTRKALRSLDPSVLIFATLIWLDFVILRVAISNGGIFHILGKWAF